MPVLESLFFFVSLGLSFGMDFSFGGKQALSVKLVVDASEYFGIFFLILVLLSFCFFYHFITCDVHMLMLHLRWWAWWQYGCFSKSMTEATNNFLFLFSAAWQQTWWTWLQRFQYTMSEQSRTLKLEVMCSNFILSHYNLHAAFSQNGQSEVWLFWFWPFAQ